MKKDETAEVLSIEGREVSVTHPGKPYFSKQTRLSKLDLVLYYQNPQSNRYNVVRMTGG